jgi:phosphate transport system permease protein
MTTELRQRPVRDFFQFHTAAALRTPLSRGVLRSVRGYLGWAFIVAAFVLLGGGMVDILVTIFRRGIASLSPQLVTQVTQGVGGGLLNAIEGTVVLAFGGILLAVPPGIAAGIYIAEFDHGPLAMILRFLSDVLVGVPSIVIGYFAYVTLVEGLGWNFSVAAGCIALAIISMPYICRTTEMALRQVPQGLREGAYALGAGEFTVARTVTLPVAFPAILTGVLLALAISVGETAPLIYTAGWSNYLWNGHLIKEPIGYLTYAIWAFITEPFESAHALAYAAALLVTTFVLVISFASRLLLDKGSRRMRRG